MDGWELDGAPTGFAEVAEAFEEEKRLQMVGCGRTSIGACWCGATGVLHRFGEDTGAQQ